MLKVHSKIWYPLGVPDYSTKIMFDPVEALLKNIPESLNEREMLEFTFCCLITEYCSILFTEDQIPQLASNLEKYLKKIISNNREIFDIKDDYAENYVEDYYSNSNVFLANIVLLYFEGFEEVPLEKVNPFFKKAQPKTLP